MKAVLIFAGLIALALSQHNINPKADHAEFVGLQQKTLGLFKSVYQLDQDGDYYNVGKNINIEANIENYTNKKAAEEFL